MIEVNDEKVEKLRTSLDLALKTHADTTYQQKNTSESYLYARDVRLRTLALRRLIEEGLTGEGEDEITGVAIARIKDLKEIVEIVFGEKIPKGQEGTKQEYTPTVFEGVYCRTDVQSVNAMQGSLVSLDFRR